MDHVCVIGGGGFIGHHVVNNLLSNGKKVTVLGRSPCNPHKFHGNISYISGDFSDPNIADKAFSDANSIINLAPTLNPGKGGSVSIQDMMENVSKWILFFEKLSDFSIDRLLIISSGGAVYGKAKKIPINEDHPTNPISPYGITKLILEKYAYLHYELNDLPVICIRPGNAYGEGQKPYMGQGFISTAIGSILDNRQIQIYGEKGTIRDYVHVADVARGINVTLDRGKIGSIYNIGSEHGYSNYEVLNIIRPLAQADHFEINIKILPERKFDVPVNVLDCKKLRSLTGWKPEISFSEGINGVWEYMKKNHNSERYSATIG